MRTFADASSSGSARTCVALSSWRVGWRTSSQRPGTSCVVNASTARSFSCSERTTRARPSTTTER